MAAKQILAAVACAALVAMGAAASADDYRPHEFLSLDLSRAVLSPKRLGPPAEFAPVAVEARTDAKSVVAEPKAGHQPAVRTSRVTERPAASATGSADRRDPLADLRGIAANEEANKDKQTKWLLLRGAILLCRPSVTVIALLDDDAVAMVVAVVTPAPVPTVVVVHPGVRAVPAVMIVAALDHDRMGVGH